MKSSNLQSDLLWHALSLIGEHHGVTVTTAFLAGMLPQLKLLQDSKTHFIKHLPKWIIYFCYNDYSSWG